MRIIKHNVTVYINNLIIYLYKLNVLFNNWPFISVERSVNGIFFSTLGGGNSPLFQNQPLGACRIMPETH
jgi:hypothetical protein